VTAEAGLPELRLDDPALALDPYPVYAALREAAPVVAEAGGERRILTRHAEVSAAFRDRRLGRIFWHRYRHEDLGIPPGEPAWNDPRLAGIAAFERWELLALEPPEHTRLRRLVMEAFTPRAVEALRERVATLAEHLLAEAIAAGGDRIALVTGYAEPFSLTVICDLLGIPESERDLLVPLSHRIVAIYEPGVRGERAADADAAATTLRELILALVRERRRRPADDLLGALVAARVDGEGLTDDQVAATAMVLLMAGHEATVNATGNGIAALAAHPAEWARIVSGTVDPRIAVEEVLRYDPPLQLFERWVLEPGVTIGGTELPVGARVAMLLGSANRDPRRFPEPDRFRVERGDAGHVAFGGGIHFCLGAPLARLEIETTLRLLAARLPDLALADAPERRGGLQFRGFARLDLAAPRGPGRAASSLSR